MEPAPSSDPFHQNTFACTVELLECVTATGHGHQKRFPGTVNLWTFPVSPVQIRGDESDPAGPPSSPDERHIKRGVQDGAEAFGWDGAWHLQRTTDVLLMHHAIEECDHAAEAGGQSARLDMVADQSNKFFGPAFGVVGYSNGVDPIDNQSASEKSDGQTERRELVIADGVGDDVTHAPSTT